MGKVGLPALLHDGEKQLGFLEPGAPADAAERYPRIAVHVVIRADSGLEVQVATRLACDPIVNPGLSESDDSLAKLTEEVIRNMIASP